MRVCPTSMSHAELSSRTQSPSYRESFCLLPRDVLMYRRQALRYSALCAISLVQAPCKGRHTPGWESTSHVPDHMGSKRQVTSVHPFKTLPPAPFGGAGCMWVGLRRCTHFHHLNRPL